jgi:hypothetical protein
MHRRPSERTLGLLVVSATTLLVVFGLTGLGPLLRPDRTVIGRNPSNDFQIMAWSLRFWPWAIAHGVAPWRTSLLWAPTGFSTLWLTTIPGPALVAIPLTLTAGPIVTYNVLVVAAIVAAGLAAYLLCWELTRNAGASAAGGLPFGLSPFVLGHTLSEHLNLLVIFPLPLLTLVGLRHWRGALSTRAFVTAFALLLLVLLSSSLEVFADTTAVLAIVAAISIIGGGAKRTALLALARRIAYAYAACLPLLVPIGIAALTTAHGAVAHPPVDFSTDLLNSVVPTPTVLLGSLGSLEGITRHFVGNIGERDGYIGLPVLAVCVAALRSDWRTLWPVASLILVAFALALGPIVAVAGRPVTSSPLSLDALPILGNGLPARLTVFASLGAAMLVAVWFARERRRALRVGAGILLVASLLPNFWPARSLPGAWATSTAFEWSTASIPAGFVQNANWSKVVPAGSNVLVLPASDRTAAQWWQAKADMQFALAVPGSPFVPPPLAADPTIVRVVDDVLPQLEGTALGAARLRALLTARHVTTVVVTPRGRGRWRAVVRRATGTLPVRLNGSLVFRVPRRLAQLMGRRLVGHGFWLEYAGARGRVVTRSRTLTDDNVQSAVAANGAVLMIEWYGHDELVRLASRTPFGWRFATLARNPGPIWTPRVAVTRDGTTVAGWIDDLQSERQFLVASIRPNGTLAIQRLDSGQGLGSYGLRAVGANNVSITWDDSLAAEWRLLSARLTGSGWTTPRTLETGLSPPSQEILGNPLSPDASLKAAR